VTACSAKHARPASARDPFLGRGRAAGEFSPEGANLLIHSADIFLFQKHLQSELEAIKQAAGLRVASNACVKDMDI
jgi:hypothetical protein